MIRPVITNSVTAVDATLCFLVDMRLAIATEHYASGLRILALGRRIDTNREGEM